MKRIRLMLVAAFSLFVSAGVLAQDVEITPMVGYVLRNDLRFKEGKMEVKDYFNIAANFSFPSNSRSGRFEILLSNSFTHATWKESEDYADLISEKNYTMMVSYFQISYVWEGEIQRDFYIFGGPTTGLVNYNVSDPDIENMPRFSIGAQTGVKLYFNHRLGFRAQCHMALPVFMGSGKHFRGITDETGENSYLNVNSTTFPANFVFDVGMIFRFRK